MRLRMTLPERKLLLWVVDLLVLNGGLLVLLALHFDYQFSWRTVVRVPLYFVVLTALWFLWASFSDCHELAATADASHSAWRTGRAGLFTALSYLLIPYITPYFLPSRLWTLIFIVVTIVGVAIWRVVYAVVFAQPAFQQRILIVGAGCSGADLAKTLAGAPTEGNPYAGSGYYAVGFVDDDPRKAGSQVQALPVLGTHKDLPELVRQYMVDKVVLAITNPEEMSASLMQGLLDCREQGLDVLPMTTLHEQITGRVAIEHAGQNLAIVLPGEEPATLRILAVAKRLGDLLISSIGLLILALIPPLVALANAIWSPGPLFYWQTRVGRAGRTFRVVKFRSMVPSAEAQSGAVWASEHDPRVTPAGRLLRRTRLDELPQVWNVLRGEMSLVGPRPERPEFVAQLVAQVPFYQARHAVRPGITGWAQVRYRYGSSVEDAKAKLEYDLYYIKHRSLYLELSILAKTAAVMFGLGGR